LAWKLTLNDFRKRRRATAIAPIKPEPRSNKDDGSGAELNENPASPFGPKLPIWKVSLTVPSDSNIANVITPLKFHTKPGAFQKPIGSGGSPFSQTPLAQPGNTQMFAPANGGFVQPGQAVQPAPPTQIESKATWSLVSAPCPHGSKGDSPSLARNMVVPPTGSWMIHPAAGSSVQRLVKAEEGEVLDVRVSTFTGVGTVPATVMLAVRTSSATITRGFEIRI